MERLIRFTDGEQKYSVPESEVENFVANVPNVRRLNQYADAEGKTYSVPEDEEESFLSTVKDVKAVQIFQKPDGSRYKALSLGRIDSGRKEDYESKGAMGGVMKAALQAQAQGGMQASEDDGSLGNWFSNLGKVIAHNTTGRLFSGDRESKLHLLRRGVYENYKGEVRPLKELIEESPQALNDILSDYMGAIAPAGVKGYVDTKLGGKSSYNYRYNPTLQKLLAIKGSGTTDAKKALEEKLQIAQDFANELFLSQEQSKAKARTELNSRDTQWQSGAVAGLTTNLSSAIPMAIPYVGVGLSAAIEGADSRNQLLQDQHFVDENGNVFLVSKADTKADATKKGLAHGILTAAIEKVGGKILGKAVGATVGKGIGKLAGTGIGSSIARSTAVKGVSKIGGYLGKPMEVLGWNGMPGEIGEEFMQGATDAYFGLDKTEAQKEGASAGGRFKEFAGDFFKGENLAELAESMLLMQAIGGGSAYLQKRHTNKQFNKIITEKIGGVSENVLNKLSPEEKARIIESHYQGLSAEEAADIINKGAGALDKFMIEKQTEATKSADGRAVLAETNPEAADSIRAARREGRDISRKMIRDLGLSEKVLGDVESRNKFGDALLEDGRKLAAKNAAKMDGQQEAALRQDIAGFIGDTSEAQRVYDRVVMKLKDASVLDDPYQREQLVMQAAEAVYAEDQARRVGGARQKARMAEKADHEARLSEAKAQAAEAAQHAENEEQTQYNDFMLAHEEARAKGGLNEARTNETPAQPNEAPRVTPPAGKAPSEVGGEVKTPKWVKEAPPAKTVVGKDGKRIVALPRNGQSGKSREPSAILGAVKSIRGISAKIPATKQNPGREIFVDKTTQGEYTNSGATKFLNARSKKGTDAEKEWAKKTLSAKVSAIPYLRDIIATAKNERHTPYEAIKNTPGHEKKKGQWGGGLYEYDVSFAVAGERYKGRMIVRCDNKGKMSLYDIVDIDDGSAVAKEMLLDKNKRSQVRSTANDKDERFSTSTQSVSNTNVEVKGVLNEKNRSRASYTSKGETKDSTASMPSIVSNSSSRVNADAVSAPPKPKTVREGKAFVNSNIGKRYTDGKKTYEITGLTKEGEVSVKVTDKIGKSSEMTLKLSGTLNNIFGTKKTSAVWSEVKPSEAEQNSQNRTKTTADDVARLADETVPTYLKAMESSHSGDNIGEDYKIESNFANEVLKMVKGMSESELGEVSASLRKALYAKGNPMPGGYKPLLDAASYALDAARAGKDSVKLPMPEHLRTRVKTTAKTPKTEDAANAKPAPKSEPKAGTKTEAGDDLSKLSEEELKRRIDEVDESLEPDDYKKAIKPLKDELAKRKGNGGENFSDKAIVDRAFGDFSDENGKPKSATELIDRGWRFVKSKVGAAYRYRLEKDGVGYHDLSSKKIRSKMPPVNYEENLKFLEEYSNRAKEKAEPKSEAAPSITPAEAMKKLGTLGAADVDTLTKAMHREERLGHAERANMIRVLRDYKRGVGPYGDPQSDYSQGGKYRASVESAKPLDDPAFVAWAKKRGVAPTTQKRNEYDKAMADMLTNRLSRWIKGVSVKTVNFIAPEEGGDLRAAKEVRAESDSKSALGEIAKGKDYGVLHNKTYGEIKYPLGRSGKKGMGFLHIVEHRMNEGASLDEAIDVALKVGIAAEIGTETKNVLNTRHLDYDGVRAIIAIQNGNIIVTGYEIDADENTAAIRRAARHNPHPHVGSDEVISALRKKLSATENSLSQSADSDKSVRLLHDGERIVGSYNRATGEIKLAKGASVETVLHELGWHAARHWAEVNADSDPKAANLLKQMKEYAESAPKEVKDAVRDVYGGLDADTLLDEIGAHRFVKDQSGKIAEALATKEGAAWYQKVRNKVVDFFKNFLAKIGYNRVNLDGIENMSPEVFGDFLADVMMSGKRLGERTAFSMEAPKGLAAKWTNNLSDYKAPIAELEKRTTGSSNNIYYLARTLEGQAQRGKNRAERAIKRVEKILGEEISPELLAQYMQLKAYEERNAKIERRNGKADASGMTPEDAKAIEKTINESGVDEAIFEEAAQILWDLQKEGLQARVDAGLLDQETANKWMTDEPHHIPWKDAVDPDSGEYVGRRMGASEFDTAEGRKTAASGDPITWMLQEYQDAMIRAAQNRLRSSIANLTRLNGDVGTIYDGIQTDSKGKRSFIKYPKGGGKAKVLSMPEGVKIESTVKNDGGMKNVLTFKESGETKYLVLNGTLGEAVAGAVTGRTLARPPAYLGAINRFSSATATTFSWAFAAKNYKRDTVDVRNNFIADFGWKKGNMLVASAEKFAWTHIKELSRYAATGELSLDEKGNPTTEFAKLVLEYEDAGGLMSGNAVQSYDHIEKQIKADFRFGKNRVRSLAKGAADLYMAVPKISELLTRIGAFAALRKDGMSAKDAAMWARESTFDFDKKGAFAPVLNSLWLFSNANIQAAHRQLRGLIKSKNGWKVAADMAVVGFVMHIVNEMLNADDDDENEKEGLGIDKDISEYDRQHYIFLRFGQKMYRTPVNLGPYGFARYIGDVTARMMTGDISIGEAAKNLGVSAAEIGASSSGVPINMGAVIQTGFPSLTQGIVQGLSGKNFAGFDLYKNKHPQNKTPDSHYGKRTTAPVYKWVAEKLNEITGGNEAKPGWIDIRPETVELVVENIGKSALRDITDLSRISKAFIIDDKDIDGNESRYWNAKAVYDQDKYELKNNSELKGDERRAYLKEHPWLYSAGKPGVTRIDNIVKRIEKLRDVEESDRATEERKAEAKAMRRKLQARVIEIMKGK